MNKFYRKKKLYMVTVVCLYSLCILCGCTKKDELILLTQDAQETLDVSGVFEETQDVSTGATETAGVDENSGAAYIVEETGTVYVHVCGAVMSPGVYELPAGSRVYEAVQAAGGFTESAEESYVNQAQELTDGCKLLIPTVEEVENGLAQEALAGENGIPTAGDGADGALQSGAQAVTGDGRININSASVEELCKIPGVGATRAAAIIAYRENHGSFESPEDIMKVSGIKEGTYGKIKDSIRVK